MGGWVERVILALNEGYTPEDIFDAILPESWSWRGPESAMWAQWTTEFEDLTGHADARVVRIGERGSEMTRTRRDSCLERERLEAVHGVRR